MASWADNLTKIERVRLNMIAGAMQLPNMTQYESLEHVLADIYSRITEAKGLSEQVSKLLGAS